MEQRTAWSAFGGVIALVAGTNTVAWAAGAAADKSTLPWWPVIAFGLITVIGLYIGIAPLLRWPPFHRLSRSTVEVLDECIREGRDARERVLRGKLDEWAVARAASEWMLRTANQLHETYPAILDRFLLAEGDPQHFSGQALAIRSIKVKLAVLEEARLALG
jgi:hypothetical protein